MKILILSYEFPPSAGEGGATTLSLLAEYAKNPELEIDLITTSIDGQFHTLKMGDNITIHRLPNKKNLTKPASQTMKEPLLFIWQAYKFSRKLAKLKKYDLSHVFFSETFGRIAMMLKWEFKLPYIVSLQGSDENGYEEREAILAKLKKPIAKKIFNRASFVVANSQWLRGLIFSADIKNEIDVIYNGFNNTGLFSDSNNHNPENFQIVCVSEITPEKNVRFLMQAFKLLSGRYSQVRLSIVGDGDEKHSLEDLAQGLDIKDRVEFAGAVAHDKVIAYYQKADLLAFPSPEDGISKIIPEALASGLPIVAADTAWTRELVRDGSNGLLAKKNDAADLAEKIEKLILDKGFLEKLAKNSLLSADAFRWESIAKQYVDIYVKTSNIAKIQRG